MTSRRLAACLTGAILMVPMLTGCQGDGNSLDDAVIGENSFIITIYPDIAPLTCENFKTLVESGFYDGLTFHRVVDDFIAQGGDPNGDGTGGSGKTIKGEFSDNGISNALSHKRGTVSMARADNYDSATCQFFICYTDLTYLDGSYAAFGEVTAGMSAVDQFLTIPRSVGRMGEISVPDQPLVIEKAVLIEADSAGNPRIQFLMKEDAADSEEETTEITPLPTEETQETTQPEIKETSAVDTSEQEATTTE